MTLVFGIGGALATVLSQAAAWAAAAALAAAG